MRGRREEKSKGVGREDQPDTIVGGTVGGSCAEGTEAAS